MWDFQISTIWQFKCSHSGYHGNQNYKIWFLDNFDIYAIKWHKNSSFITYTFVPGPENMCHFLLWKRAKMPNFHIWSYGNLIKYANLFVRDIQTSKHPRWNVKISQLEDYWRPNHKFLTIVEFSNINNLTIQMLAFWLPWQPEL